MGAGLRAKKAVFAAVAAILMVAVALIPISGCESSDAGASGSWTCTITISDGTTITTKYAENGADLTDTTPVEGNNGSADVGSWGFDDTTGYGPFGSFYAAVDVTTGKIAYHLKPSDLSKAIDGTSISATGYNIMWVLPTVWMSVDSSGALTLSSTKADGATAPAHTIEGTTYKYLAIGVYEAYVQDSKVYSFPGKTPTTYTSIYNFQTYARATGADGGHSMIWNFYQWQLYRFCSLAVMENFDSQAQIGYGNVEGERAGRTGPTSAWGPYYGTTGASTTGERLFIENAWGNVLEYVGDAYWTGGQLKAGQNSCQVAGTGNGLNTVYSYSIPYKYGTAPYSTALGSWGLPLGSSDTWSTDAPDFAGTNNYGYSLIVGGCYYGYGNAAGLSDFRAGANNGTFAIGSRLAMVLDDDTAAIAVPDVSYDHSDLEALLEEYGYSESLMNDLPSGPEGSEKYDDLGEIAEFKHVGWIVDGVQYPVTQPFVKTTDHTARSVWVGLPAVTYDHSELVGATGDPRSVAGLSNGLEIKGHYSYEQLPSRDGYAHVGWRIGDQEVAPTGQFVTRNSHTAVSLWEAQEVTYDHSGLKQKLTAVGGSESEMAGLPSSIVIPGNSGYGKLPDVGEFTHTGWLIDGVEYPANHQFVKTEDHTAVSVWKGLPAVTYNHNRLMEASGDPDSVAGLSTGMEMTGRTNYEKLPDRDGYEHVGWLVGDTEVGPTAAFVTPRTHTAISLWSEIPMVTFDHSGLTDVVGTDAEGVSDLQAGMTIDGNTCYPKLPDTAGYRHIGWKVGDTTVGPTAELLSTETHTAVSLWEEKTGGDFVPMPDDGRWDDGIYIPAKKESEQGWLGDSKNILIIAIIAAIIAELAVLQISRKR